MYVCSAQLVSQEHFPYMCLLRFITPSYFPARLLFISSFSHQRACYTSFAYTSVNAGKSSSHTRDILSSHRKTVPRTFGLKDILNIVLKNNNTHFHFK